MEKSFNFELKNGPKCPLHGRQLDLICLNDRCGESRLICNKCLIGGQLHGYHSAIIFDEFLQNPYLILDAFPIFEEHNIIDKLSLEGAAMEEYFQKLENEADARFDELLIEAEEEINNVWTKLKAQIVEISKIQRNIQNQVKSVIDVSKLKTLFEEDWKKGLKKFKDSLNASFAKNIDQNQIGLQLNSYQARLSQVKRAIGKEEITKLTKKIVTIIESYILTPSNIENSRLALTASSGLRWKTGSSSVMFYAQPDWTHITTAELTPPFSCSLKITGLSQQKAFQIGFTDHLISSPSSFQFIQKEKFIIYGTDASVHYDTLQTGRSLIEKVLPFDGEWVITFEVDSDRLVKIKFKGVYYFSQKLNPTMKFFLYFCPNASDIEATIL